MLLPDGLSIVERVGASGPHERLAEMQDFSVFLRRRMPGLYDEGVAGRRGARAPDAPTG